MWAGTAEPEPRLAWNEDARGAEIRNLAPTSTRECITFVLGISRGAVRNNALGQGWGPRPGASSIGAAKEIGEVSKYVDRPEVEQVKALQRITADGEFGGRGYGGGAVRTEHEPGHVRDWISGLPVAVRDVCRQSVDTYCYQVVKLPLPVMWQSWTFCAKADFDATVNANTATSIVVSRLSFILLLLLLNFRLVAVKCDP